MRYSMFMSENEQHELQGTVHDCFCDVDLEVPGIIGIQIPTHVGTVEEHEFYDWLIGAFEPNGPHHVVIPKPDLKWFNMRDPSQVSALAGRVSRDRIDGVRYNRLFIALYGSDNPLPESVIVEHDWFITVDGKGGPYRRVGRVYTMGEKK